MAVSGSTSRHVGSHLRGLTKVTLWPRLGPKQRLPLRAAGLSMPPHPERSASFKSFGLPLPTIAINSSRVIGVPFSAAPMVSTSCQISDSVTFQNFSHELLIRIQRRLIAAV